MHNVLVCMHYLYLRALNLSKVCENAVEMEFAGQSKPNHVNAVPFVGKEMSVSMWK